MVSPADAARLRTAQRGIRTLVERDLSGFFQGLNLSQPERSRDRLLVFVPLLVKQYGESAAAVAADWYDDQRDKAGVRGRFRAQLVTPVFLPAVQGTVRRAAAALFTDNPLNALTSLEGPTGKQVLEFSRQTVARASDRDPQASGWERVIAPGACQFCQVLADHVYTETGAEFEAHGSCNCSAAPKW